MNVSGSLAFLQYLKIFKKTIYVIKCLPISKTEVKHIQKACLLKWKKTKFDNDQVIYKQTY